MMPMIAAPSLEQVGTRSRSPGTTVRWQPSTTGTCAISTQRGQSQKAYNPRSPATCSLCKFETCVVVLRRDPFVVSELLLDRRDTLKCVINFLPEPGDVLELLRGAGARELSLSLCSWLASVPKKGAEVHIKLRPDSGRISRLRPQRS
jgi:hypothetical protein